MAPVAMLTSSQLIRHYVRPDKVQDEYRALCHTGIKLQPEASADLPTPICWNCRRKQVRFGHALQESLSPGNSDSHGSPEGSLVSTGSSTVAGEDSTGADGAGSTGEG